MSSCFVFYIYIRTRKIADFVATVIRKLSNSLNTVLDTVYILMYNLMVMVTPTILDAAVYFFGIRHLRAIYDI